MKKRIISLLLAVILVASCFAGCNNEGDGGESTGGVENPNGYEKIDELTLPLTDDPDAEITIWTLWENQTVMDPNQLLAVQKMEEITGVHVNWVCKTAAECAEAFNLLTTSDDLPDIIFAGAYGTYPGGVEQGIADGVFMDCTDLVNYYMPNYRAILASDPDLNKAVKTDSGKYAALWRLSSSDEMGYPEKIFYGMAYRQEFVDAIGYTGDLVTVEDWYTMFKMAKEAGYETPWLPASGGYGLNGSFLTAYGVASGLYVDGETIKFGPAEDGYGEFLKEMRKWYEEGLIDPNYSSQTGLQNYYADASVFAAGETVAFGQMYLFTETVPYVMGWDPNYDATTGRVVAVENPVLNEGDESAVMITTYGTMAQNCYYISADCENPELVAKWLDFQYTEQGMVLNAYGVEGVTYTVNEDPNATYKYVYTEDFLNKDTTGRSELGVLGSAALGWYNYSASYQTQAGVETLLASEELWTPAKLYTIPTLSLTSEESTIYQQYYTNIATLVSEYTVQYITGITDQSFEDFVQQLYDYNLQAVIDVYQAAFERYLAR